jgi:hypothetical protein
MRSTTIPTMFLVFKAWPPGHQSSVNRLRTSAPPTMAIRHPSFAMGARCQAERAVLRQHPFRLARSPSPMGHNKSSNLRRVSAGQCVRGFTGWSAPTYESRYSQPAPGAAVQLPAQMAISSGIADVLVITTNRFILAPRSDLKPRVRSGQRSS